MAPMFIDRLALLAVLGAKRRHWRQDWRMDWRQERQDIGANGALLVSANVFFDHWRHARGVHRQYFSRRRSEAKITRRRRLDRGLRHALNFIPTDHI